MALVLESASLANIADEPPVKKISSKSVLQRDICHCYSSIMYCLWRLRIIYACKLLELLINTMSFQDRSARCERHATKLFLILLKALKVPNLECVCFKPCCLGSRARFQRYFVSVVSTNLHVFVITIHNWHVLVTAHLVVRQRNTFICHICEHLNIWTFRHMFRVVVWVLFGAAVTRTPKIWWILTTRFTKFNPINNKFIRCKALAWKIKQTSNSQIECEFMFLLKFKVVLNIKMFYTAHWNQPNNVEMRFNVIKTQI